MVRGGIFLLVVVLAAPSLAAAETMSFGDAAAMLAKSCGAEIIANCRGVNLDANRLKECLSRNQDVTVAAVQERLSPRASTRSRSGSPRASRSPNACTREIVKLCGGSTKETSKSSLPDDGAGRQPQLHPGRSVDAGYR